MSYQDEIKSVTVRVSNGSGVIVQPLEDNCFYILTAYHVVEGKALDQITLDFESSSFLDGKTVKIQGMYVNEKQDAAILKIERKEGKIASFYPTATNRKDDTTYWHAGYPNNQNNPGIASCCKLHDFYVWLGSYDNDFEEYKYPYHLLKAELEGMSGGGIFDNHHHLIGVHKSLAAKEETEQLGKNVMIPWNCFEQLIVKNGLSHVARFNLSTFEAFKDEIFSFEGNLGAKKKLEVLLLSLAQYRTEILGISPLKYYDEFQKSRKVKEYTHAPDLKKEDWVKFGEFIVAMKAIWGLDVINNLNEVFPKFQYVQSANDFDIFEVTQKLDPSLLGIVSDTNVVFVVGGIQNKGYHQDVKSKNIPDIAVGLKPGQGFDIARTGRAALNAFTFVNAHFFKEAMEANSIIIRDCEGNKLEVYRDLINSKIWT